MWLLLFEIYSGTLLNRQKMYLKLSFIFNFRATVSFVSQLCLLITHINSNFIQNYKKYIKLDSHFSVFSFIHICKIFLDH